MKIISSNKQKFFSLMIRSLGAFAFMLVPALVQYYFFDQGFFSLGEITLLYVGISIGVPIIFFAWYYIFNSGQDQIENPSIEFSNQGITLNRLGDSYLIDWLEYKGYQISGFFYKQVHVKSKSGIGIHFDYYLFTPKQRKKIFTIFNARKTS